MQNDPQKVQVRRLPWSKLLPPALLARLEFNCLERWFCSDEMNRACLWDVERDAEGRGRELLRLLLQAYIERKGTGDVGKALEVLEQGRPLLYTHKRIHTRKIVTLFGEIKVRRTGYRQEGKQSIHPLDEELQLPARSYSYELQRRLVKWSVQSPFDEAIEAIRESTGVNVPKRSAEEILVDASVDFEDFYEQRRVGGRKVCGRLLVGSIDCKGIPTVKAELALRVVRRGRGEKAQKKKMATVAAVFTQKPRIRTPEQVVESLFNPDAMTKRQRGEKPEDKRIWASIMMAKESFIQNVAEEMKRRDPSRKLRWVVVTDGERALQRLVCKTLKGATLVLDFLHVLEKMWAAAHALHGEGAQEAEAFVRTRALALLEGRVSQVVKGMRQIATKRRMRGQKRKVFLDAADYFYRNKSRMSYNEYLLQGFPIANGAVEGACKNLIKSRMERSGMRWTIRMAEAMVKLRAAYLSGDFDEYWAFHVRREQERLYPKGRWKLANASS